MQRLRYFLIENNISFDDDYVYLKSNLAVPCYIIHNYNFTDIMIIFKELFSNLADFVFVAIYDVNKHSKKFYYNYSYLCYVIKNFACI